MRNKKEIMDRLGGKWSMNVNVSIGTRGALKLERTGQRIEITHGTLKVVLREWHFYFDGGWKTTGYEEFKGISKEHDAVSSAIQIFAASAVRDSYLVEYLNASD